jgi:hypothetical protein
MTQQTRAYKPGIFIITLAVLSIGVLSGCDYCSPVLLAAIAGRLVIGGYRMVSDALSVQPLASL